MKEICFFPMHNASEAVSRKIQRKCQGLGSGLLDSPMVYTLYSRSLSIYLALFVVDWLRLSNN